jgi:serine/threonine protein kinase
MIGKDTVLQNRYRVQKQIGQGGMGAVYVATDERFGSTVAIKETLFTDANYSKAFEREARLLNNLRHPALPRVSDHFSDDDGQFLVMEYITGEDLSLMMEKKGGAFPLKDVLNWADQLLDALDYLHTQEMPVIHRDIKPQNLKLTPRGQIILLDFGLAKGNPTDAQHQTAAKSVFGFSRSYASLEQMQGTGTDPRSDLYSLGATLYHLLTGVPPVDALTRAMQVLNGGADPLKSANETDSQVPVGISEVLQKALALNANFRPTSAVAMRAMLAESEVTKADAQSSPIKKPATSLLTQNTEVLGNKTKGKAEQATVQTEVLPASQASVPPQPNLTENKSVLTEIESQKRNIQIPVEAKAATEIPPSTPAQPNGLKRGKAIGAAAAGGLLLVGSVLGGLYWWQPGAVSGTVTNSNANSQPIANSESVTDSGSATSSNSNTSVITPLQSPTAPQTLTTKKDEGGEKSTEKTSTENPAPKNETQAKETAPKDDDKVIVTDKEGNKVFENGKVVTKDGTTVEPDGRVTKNGVVVVQPPPTEQQPRPLPPNVRPPLTKEQFESLTPAQKRRLRQIMENQRRQQNMNRPPRMDKP